MPKPPTLSYLSGNHSSNASHIWPQVQFDRDSGLSNSKKWQIASRSGDDCCYIYSSLRCLKKKKLGEKLYQYMRIIAASAILMLGIYRLTRKKMWVHYNIIATALPGFTTAIIVQYN